MAYTISALITLYGFWLLLSGFFDSAFLMLSGLACALAVVWFARRMDVIDREGHPIHLGWGAVLYWPWLIAEIVRSGWQVTRIILTPSLPISPALVRVKPTQDTEVGLVVHANSITLTPGTLTVDVSRGELVVHALTADGGDELAHGAIDRRVAALEGAR
jgi:multicomponent Na+:H+ antiporter subunit E